MLRHNPPESAGIRGSNRLAFVDDRGCARKQRRVHDVGVTHNPANIRCGPRNIARVDVIDVLHRPHTSDRVSTVIAHNTLRFARGSGGVEDIERISGLDGDRVSRLGGSYRIVP